jgi:transcriptional regulator with XRE-family HTH domain
MHVDAVTASDETFATRLRSARRDAGMSVIELARVSGISRAYLYELEHEERRAQPSAGIVVRLATALAVPVEPLMGAAAAGRARAIPPSLRSYLDLGEASPTTAGILELIAARVPGGATLEDWKFLEGALRRTVLAPQKRPRPRPLT